MPRLKSAAVAGVVAVVLAACSSSTTTTPEPTATPAAQQSATGPLPSAGVVAELEALIPDTIGGFAMLKQSMKGSDLAASGSGDAAAEKFIQDLGVSPESIAIAFGYGLSADGTTGAAMFVFQAKGAGRDKLLQVFKDAQDAQATTAMVWETKSVAGKQVEVSTTPAGAQTIYLYATDDVLFELAVNDVDAATAVIASLP
jgi:hypothetical protein